MPEGEQHPYMVSIGRHTFDPAETRALRARRVERRPDSAPDPNDTRIVQFERPLTGPDMDRIRADYGLALTAYLPNLAYVERVDAATRRRLGRDPLVRAVAAYLPEYKLDDPVDEAARRRSRVGCRSSRRSSTAARSRSWSTRCSRRARSTCSPRTAATWADSRGWCSPRRCERSPTWPAGCPTCAGWSSSRESRRTTSTPPASSRAAPTPPPRSGTAACTARARSSASWRAEPRTSPTASSRMPPRTPRGRATGRCSASATRTSGLTRPSWRGMPSATSATTQVPTATAAAPGPPELASSAVTNATLLTELTNNMNAGAFVHTNSWHDNRHGAGVAGAVQPGRGRHRHLPPQQRGPRAAGVLRQQRRGAGAARNGQERTLRLRCHR